MGWFLGGDSNWGGGQDMKQLAKQVEGSGFKFILIINCQLVQTAIQKWVQNDYEINAEHTIKNNANIEIEVWPYKDNAALKFTANLSKPSVSIVTPGALTPGLRVDSLQIHIHNQYKKAPLDQKPVPSPLLPYPKHACERKEGQMSALRGMLGTPMGLSNLLRQESWLTEPWRLWGRPWSSRVLCVLIKDQTRLG